MSDPKPIHDAALGTALAGARSVVHAVGSLGRAIGGALWLPERGKAEAGSALPGTAAGIEGIPGRDVPPDPSAIRLQCTDYGREQLHIDDGSELATLLEGRAPDWAHVRWLNIDGLHPFVVDQVRQAFGLHTLAAEDVLHTHQRPRMERYGDHLFVVLRMVRLERDHLASEQVSMFLGESTLITFQERPGDVWDPIRSRLAQDGSRLREQDAGFLLYALIDAAVDHGFPLLERYGVLLDELEDDILRQPSPAVLERIHSVRRELIALRRVVWPMRELVDQLTREDSGLSAETRTFMRDVYTHTIQLMDVLDSLRETSSSLMDLYMSTVSNRTNEVMKVLTIMASVFIPITFLAGVYGMNFEHIPELGQPWAYPAFWGVCAVITAGLLWYFARRGWLGR